MREKSRSQCVRYNLLQHFRRRLWAWGRINLAQPESTPHDAAFRCFVNEMEQAAKPIDLTDGADVGPYRRADLRPCEAALVKYLAWVAEIKAQSCEMSSEIFVDEVRSPHVLARLRRDVPVAPDMIAGVPPAVFFGVMEEAQPPIDHGGRHPDHVGAHTDVDHARL